jgi:signal transduction histidine kinase
MRESVVAAITLATTIGLVWLPLSGMWRHILSRAYYVPILATGAKYGPIAGFLAGIAAWVLSAFLANAAGVADMSFFTFSTLDLPFIGLVGGRASWRWRLKELDALSRSVVWREDAGIPAAQIDSHLNPLASIQGAASLLADDEIPIGVRKELVAIISTECTQLAGRLVNLLQQNRPSDAAPSSEVEIAQIIDSAMRQAEFILCGSKYRIRKEISPSLPAISCNPVQVRDLLITLALVLIRFMPAGHFVLIDVHQQDCGVSFGVIAQSEHTWLSRFSRIINSLFGSPVERLSLDLAAAYDIVYRHGGKIEGGLSRTGGRFAVWLPVRLNDEIGSQYPRS